MWADVLASLSNRLSDKGKAKETLNFICQHAQNYLRQDIVDTCFFFLSLSHLIEVLSEMILIKGRVKIHCQPSCLEN